GSPTTSSTDQEIATAAQSAPASEPSIQLRTSRKESPSAFQKTSIEVTAPKKEETASPARTVRLGVIWPSARARPRVAASAASAPTKAASGSTTETPSSSTRTAPVEAADEIGRAAGRKRGRR